MIREQLPECFHVVSPTRCSAAFCFSLSDASVAQQAALAVADVVSSKPVVGTRLGSQRQRPQMSWIDSWNR